MRYYKVIKTLSLDFLNTLKTSGDKEFSTIDDVEFFYYPEKIATFLSNNKCICCGIKATHVNIEQSKGNHDDFKNPHLNVYASTFTMYGKFTSLLTVDHDELKSKGGNDSFENYNTMCIYCNNMRGDRFTLEEFLDEFKHKGTDLINERSLKLYEKKFTSKKKKKKNKKPV